MTSRSSLPSIAADCHSTSSGLIPSLEPSASPWIPLSVPSKYLSMYSCPLPEEPSRLERQTKRLRGWFLPLSGCSQAKRISPDFSACAVYCAGDSPACSAFALTVKGLRLSCGADGSQPILSARTLKSIKCPLNFDASASGERSSCAVSFS